MTIMDAIEFYMAVSACVFEWLESKFAYLMLVMVLSMRNLFGISDDITMIALLCAHVAYFVLNIVAIYVNGVLLPRQKINITMQCS